MSGYYQDNQFFIGSFDEEIEELFVPLAVEIRDQSMRMGGLIEIFITSDGGGYYHFLHILELVEAAKRSGVVVRTLVPSAAYSAGSMLAVAGTEGERYIGRRAEHLAHYGFVVSEESTIRQLKRNNDWKTRSFNDVVKHYETYCNIPDLKDHLNDDCGFIPAAQAKKWGMADKFMDQWLI